MKKNLLLFIILIPLFGFGQITEPELYNNAKQFAYVNEIRIDSIQALYAQVSISEDYILTASISYGQNRSLASNVLRKKDGDLFSFDSIAALLNLLDYNGWEPVPGIQIPGKSGNLILIIKRKQRL